MNGPSARGKERMTALNTNSGGVRSGTSSPWPSTCRHQAASTAARALRGEAGGEVRAPVTDYLTIWMQSAPRARRGSLIHIHGDAERQETDTQSQLTEEQDDRLRNDYEQMGE